MQSKAAGHRSNFGYPGCDFGIQCVISCDNGAWVEEVHDELDQPVLIARSSNTDALLCPSYHMVPQGTLWCLYEAHQSNSNVNPSVAIIDAQSNRFGHPLRQC